MPKFPTFPTLYNECKTISISKLKEWGYLKPETWKSGEINWSRNGEKTASIWVTVNIQDSDSYIILDYKSNGTPISYMVKLTSVPSNIGKGAVWYFICPKTGKRCRNLYLVGGYFYHRSAFQGCMYEKQTYSHKNRDLCQMFEKAFGSDKVYEQLYSKGFKKNYAGKPTKKYLKLMRNLEDSRGLKEAELIARIFL
jgi:hypothetical protein